MAVQNGTITKTLRYPGTLLPVTLRFGTKTEEVNLGIQLAFPAYPVDVCHGVQEWRVYIVPGFDYALCGCNACRKYPNNFLLGTCYPGCIHHDLNERSLGFLGQVYDDWDRMDIPLFSLKNRA